MSETVLRAERLSKSFGGIAAVNNVSLEVHAGEVHAVIGPNGAGKSTLINLLSGDLRPSGGSILYKGREIAGFAAHRIARLGIGHSYQRINIFAGLSVFENVRLAAQAELGGAMRFFRPVRSYGAVNGRALAALANAGLETRGDTPAAALSHGEQRQLEIAMVLATAPGVLLLDEPFAGMDTAESARMVEMVARLARTFAILLVEHDMDAVFSIAHTLTVMVNGEVLESGDPASIRRSKAVRDAYLGDADFAE